MIPDEYLKLSAWPSEVGRIMQAILNVDAEFVIEIGCYRGVTTKGLATVAETLVCIDPWDGAQDGSNDEVYAEFMANKPDNCIVHRQRAYDVDVTPYADKTGVVFIDGLHTMEGVLADIKKYEPLLVDGGYLFLHDVFDVGWGDGIREAINLHMAGTQRTVNYECYFPSPNECAIRGHGESGLAWWRV